MTDNWESKSKFERFIEDWHWDNKSYKYAKALGQFLSEFLDDLKAQTLSQRTINKHTANCELIGYLESGYRYQDTFSPQAVFYSPQANYVREFKRKVSDSKYAIQSYESTWRKIHKYAKRMGLLDQNQ